MWHAASSSAALTRAGAAALRRGAARRQAMDRCHRIGQRKPVLVFRLATALSVEGKLLKRANSKLALERLVIKKGAFLPGQVRARAAPPPEAALLCPAWLPAVP